MGRVGYPGGSLPGAPRLSLLLLKQLRWDRLAGSVRVRGARYNDLSYSSRLLDPPFQGQASPPSQCRSKSAPPPSKEESGPWGLRTTLPRRLREPARLSFRPGSRPFGPTMIAFVGLTERYQFWQLEPTPQSHKARKTETRAKRLEAER